MFPVNRLKSAGGPGRVLINFPLCFFSEESKNMCACIALEYLINNKTNVIFKIYTCGKNSMFAPSLNSVIISECEKSLNTVGKMLEEYDALVKDTAETFQTMKEIRENIIEEYQRAINTIHTEAEKNGFSRLPDGTILLNNETYVPERKCMLEDNNVFQIGFI